MHASRSFGSMGQGAFLFRQRRSPFINNILPANPKTSSLCSEIHTSAGTFDAIPARTAPSPKLTSKAGSAQHMSVLSEPNNVK
jgi:hypothetical protein